MFLKTLESKEETLKKDTVSKESRPEQTSYGGKKITGCSAFQLGWDGEEARGTRRVWGKEQEEAKEEKKSVPACITRWRNLYRST